ncbi:hypothetical protein JCM8202_000454 [Rhodotorula sphaerocarpa]
MVREIVEDHKPLAYVLGTQPFFPLPVDLAVRPPTLIPRPETEHWVNVLLEKVLAARPPATGSSAPQAPSRPFRILDIGTGSGCIALALTYGLGFRPDAKSDGRSLRVQTVAVDQSKQALQLARENAERCGISTRGRSTEPGACADSADTTTDQPDPAVPLPPLTLLHADLFAPDFASTALAAAAASSSGPRRFDLIVSNPPYIPEHEYLTLDASVRVWEDRRALVGERCLPPEADGEAAAPSPVPSDGTTRKASNTDGLVFYRRIVSLLDELLAFPPSSSTPGHAAEPECAEPVVAFEVGRGQATAVRDLLSRWRPRTRTDSSDGPTLETEIVTDPWGVERAVFARWKRHRDPS